MLQFFASWLKAGRGKTAAEKAEGLKETFAAVETLEGAFREISKGKPFFGGDSVGYLDIALGALLAGMLTTEVRDVVATRHPTAPCVPAT